MLLVHFSLGPVLCRTHAQCHIHVARRHARTHARKKWVSAVVGATATLPPLTSSRRAFSCTRPPGSRRRSRTLSWSDGQRGALYTAPPRPAVSRFLRTCTAARRGGSLSFATGWISPRADTSFVPWCSCPAVSRLPRRLVRCWRLHDGDAWEVAGGGEQRHLAVTSFVSWQCTVPSSAALIPPGTSA